MNIPWTTAALLFTTACLNVADSREHRPISSHGAFGFLRPFQNHFPRRSLVLFSGDAPDVKSNDLSSLSDVTALEKAVMLAGNIADAKDEDAKNADLRLRIVEEARDGLNEMMKRASANRESAESLECFIEKTPAPQLAVILLKEAATAAAEKVIETKKDIAAAELMVNAAVDDRANAMRVASVASNDAKAAEDRMMSVEEFSGSDEVVERRRDLAVIHAAHHLADDAKKVARAANAVSRRWEAQEKKTEEFLKDLLAKETQLNADLEELKYLVKGKTMST